MVRKYTTVCSLLDAIDLSLFSRLRVAKQAHGEKKSLERYLTIDKEYRCPVECKRCIDHCISGMLIHIHKIVTEYSHTSTRIRIYTQVASGLEQNFAEIHTEEYQEVNLRITAWYTNHGINNVNQWTYTRRELYTLYKSLHCRWILTLISLLLVLRPLLPATLRYYRCRMRVTSSHSVAKESCGSL